MLCFLHFLRQHRQFDVLPHHFGPIHSICIALLCSTYGADHDLSGRTRSYGPKSSSRHPVVCKTPRKFRSSLSSSSPSIDASIRSSIHSSTHPSIHLSVHPCIRSIQPLVHPSIPASIHASMHTLAYASPYASSIVGLSWLLVPSIAGIQWPKQLLMRPSGHQP